MKKHWAYMPAVSFAVVIAAVLINRDNAVEVVAFSLGLTIAVGVHSASEALVVKFQRFTSGDKSRYGEALELLPCGIALAAMGFGLYAVDVNFGQHASNAVQHSSIEVLKTVLAFAVVRKSL